MSTLFTNLPNNRVMTRLCLLLAVSVLGACASKAQQSTGSDRPVSKYAEQREGAAAGSSDSMHVPPVPHDPTVVPFAEKAIPEFIQALQLLRNNESEKALVVFQSLSARYPQLSGPLVNQGLAHLQLKQYEDAQAALNQAIKVNSRNPYAYNALGLVLREQGKFEEAQQAYTQAITLDPLYARAHFNLGVLAELYMQDYHAALAYFSQYQNLQQEPDRTVKNWIADLKRRATKQKPKTAPVVATDSETSGGQSHENN